MRDRPLFWTVEKAVVVEFQRDGVTQPERLRQRLSQAQQRYLGP